MIWGGAGDGQQDGRLVLGGKVCTLFISMDYGIVSSERDNSKNHIFFSPDVFQALETSWVTD